MLKYYAILFVTCFGTDPNQEWTVVGRNGKPVRTRRSAFVETPIDEEGWTVVGRKGKPVVMKKSVPAEDPLLETLAVVLDDHLSKPHVRDEQVQYSDEYSSGRDSYFDDYGLWAFPVWETDFDYTYYQEVDIGYQPAEWMPDDLYNLGLYDNYRLIDLKCDIDVSFVHEAMSVLKLSGNEFDEINPDTIVDDWIHLNPEVKNARRVFPSVYEEFGCPKPVDAEHFIDSTRMKGFRESLSDKSRLIKYLATFDQMEGFACFFIDVAWNYIIYDTLFKLEIKLQRLIDEGSQITLEDILYVADPNPMALAAMAVSRRSDWTKQVDRLHPEVFEEYSNDIWGYFDTEAVPMDWLTDLAKRVSPRLLGELFESADIVYAQQDPPSPSTCITRIGWTLINLLEAVQDQREELRNILGNRISQTLSRSEI